MTFTFYKQNRDVGYNLYRSEKTKYYPKQQIAGCLFPKRREFRSFARKFEKGEKCSPFPPPGDKVAFSLRGVAIYSSLPNSVCMYLCIYVLRLPLMECPWDRASNWA